MAGRLSAAPCRENPNFGDRGRGRGDDCKTLPKWKSAKPVRLPRETFGEPVRLPRESYGDRGRGRGDDCKTLPKCSMAESNLKRRGEQFEK